MNYNEWTAYWPEESGCVMDGPSVKTDSLDLDPSTLQGTPPPQSYPTIGVQNTAMLQVFGFQIKHLS